MELVFSFVEMCQIMRLIAKEGWQRDVTEWLIQNFQHTGEAFNLRTQQQAFRNYQYALNKNLDWAEYIKVELQRNLSGAKAFLYQFMGKNPIRTLELKQQLLRTGSVQTPRTAERKIAAWLETEELYKVSGEQRNFLVSIYPPEELEVKIVCQR